MKPTKIANLRIPKDYSLEKTGCTQSLARCFKECPRKFLFKINRWQSKKGQEKFVVGNIIHDVLSILYKSEAFNIKVKINKYIQGNPDIFQFIEKQKVEYFKILTYGILRKYVDYYINDFKIAKFTNTEREFAVSINGILWRGKIDGEHIIKRNRSLWTLETKTKGRISDGTIEKGLSMDFQGRLYCRAKEIESKKKVSGFIYNVIRKPQSKLRKNESLEQFSQRLIDDIDKRPEYYYMRWEVPLTDRDKEEFDEDLRQIYDQFNDFIHYNRIKRRNTFSCTDGSFPCEYLDACIQGHTGGYYQLDRIFMELRCGL